MAGMAKPVIVVVDDEEASRRSLTEELESRYGSQYQIVAAASPDAALARLEELRAEGARVPLVLADQWMPGMTGTEFLARVKQVISTARRGLLTSAPNISVRYHTEIAAGGGDRHLEHLLLRDRETGETAPAPAAGLFILIGARPSTSWLPGSMDRDQWEFLLTGPDTAHWPLRRAPFLLETSLPGVFAAGDIRHGSVKRVASAVGEGSIAIRFVHDYLAQALAGAPAR